MYKRAEELETGEASFSSFSPLLLIQNGIKLFLKFFIPKKTRLLGQTRNLVGKVFFGKMVKKPPNFHLIYTTNQGSMYKNMRADILS